MDRFTKRILRDFQESIKTWNKKPSFVRVVYTKGNKIYGEVYTKNKIYGFVNNGTKKHFVGPRRARVLAFRSKYNSKTSPGRVSAKGGGPSGNMAFSKGHWVKGIAPRKFDKQIAKLRKDNFEDDMGQALDLIMEVS